MHYYPHHIGDYQRDTAHLSVTEHGVYRLLMDHYYATEKPIPADINSLCRIIRATSKPERQAVESVTTQFFTADGNHLKHKRIEAEIAEYEVIKLRNQNNGRLGGRPPKANPNKTQSKPSGLFLGNPDETLPRTKNQEPSPPAPQGEEDAPKRVQQPKQPPPDDETWLKELESDNTYAGINVRGELGKMQRWCETNRKKPSRKRFVNWLNRAEKPFLLPGMNGHKPKHPAYTKESATAGLTGEQIGTF